jgi:hypothetical protein
VGRASRHEIDRLKRDADFVRLACRRFGYFVDAQESTPRGNPTNWVLRREADDAKLLARRHQNGSWIYRALRGTAAATDDPRGLAWSSIIDFVQVELALPRGPGTRSFGLVLRELRTEVHGLPATPPPRSEAPGIPPTPSQPPRPSPTILQRWNRALEADTSTYLEGRGLSPAILSSPRFRTTWRLHCGAVFFAHRNAAGDLTYFEIKNGCVPGPKGGVKTGYFRSNPQSGTTHLVLTESAVNALSFAQLHPKLPASFRSFGGRIGVFQLEAFIEELRRIPTSTRILIAFDNDEEGRAMDDLVRKSLPTGTLAETSTPPSENDWNDYLQHLRRQQSW